MEVKQLLQDLESKLANQESEDRHIIQIQCHDGFEYLSYLSEGQLSRLRHTGMFRVAAERNNHANLKTDGNLLIPYEEIQNYQIARVTKL